MDGARVDQSAWSTHLVPPPDGVAVLADGAAALPLGAHVLVAERLGESAGEGFAVAIAVVVGEALNTDPAAEGPARADIAGAEVMAVALVAQLPRGLIAVVAPFRAVAEAAGDLANIFARNPIRKSGPRAPSHGEKATQRNLGEDHDRIPID